MQTGSSGNDTKLLELASRDVGVYTTPRHLPDVEADSKLLPPKKRTDRASTKIILSREVQSDTI